MRLVKTKDYNWNTMQLAKPVLDSQRRVLIAEGKTIHPKYLSKLMEFRISYLIVEDRESEGITLEDMLDMGIWVEGIQTVQAAFSEAATKKALPLQPLQPLQRLVGRFIVETKGRKAIQILPSSSVAEEQQMYAHAVNVALLSIEVGKRLGYNELKLRDLALGSILHDIGKVIQSGSGTHMETGYDYLRQVRELSSVSAHVALQHHERLNGSGAPRGIQGKDFHEFAQICGLCDLYENLISFEEIPPHEAIEAVMAQSGIGYSYEVVLAFTEGVPSYPPGARVQLQDGTEAIVVKVAKHMQRPLVKILDTNDLIDLSDHPTIMITGLLPATNIPVPTEQVS